MPAEFAAFRDWSKRYLAATPAGRATLLGEGVGLAKIRRALMAKFIVEDPELALALAVPMVIRQQLPAEIVAQLEERVSGRGQLSVMAVTPNEGETVGRPTFRAAVIGQQLYDAYVYGRRAPQSTLIAPTSIVGVAVDKKLAVSESPVRLLESGELAAGRQVSDICDVSGDATATDAAAPLNVAASNAVEYNGIIHILCHVEHVTELEAKLASQERDHTTAIAADGGQGSSTVGGRPDYTWTHGTKKLLLILIDFSDKPGGTTTVTNAVNLINGTTGVHNYYAVNSFGGSDLHLAPLVSGSSADVTPVLRMDATAASYTASGNYYALHTDAEAKATAAGFAVNTYDTIGVVHATVFSGWSGLAEVTGTHFWIQGFGFKVVAHEIGHNYGLNHANFWKVTDGNPTSAAGSSTEYGDPFDVMGNGNAFAADFSHWNKSILQWIPDSAVTLGENAGTYRIYRFDGVQAANLANPRALKVVRDATRDFWIGYRRGSGNASLNGGAYVLWGYNYNQQGNLLDMTTPGNTPADAGLAIGQTFTDSLSGISITPTAQGGSGTEEYLDVQLSYAPRIQWSQANFVVDGQDNQVSLTLQRTKNSAGAISVNFATAPGTALSPANFTTTSGGVSWPGSDSLDRSVNVTLVPHAPAGTSTAFTVTLSAAAGATLWGSPTATVNVIDAGVRDPSFGGKYIYNGVRKVLPLPDGTLIIGGGFPYLYNSTGTIFYSRSGVGRFLASGDLDPAFASGGGAAGTVYDLARQPDGRIIAVGQFASFDGVTGKNNIVRLLADGSLDPSFTPGTAANGIVYSVVLQPDGKILIGGAFNTFNGTPSEYLARLNADGSVDTTFVGPNFNGTTGGKVTALALQADGKLLAGGSFTYSGTVANICRVTTTGALDATFSGLTTGANSTVNKIVVQPNGRILLAGAFATVNATARSGLARLLATGALDPTFAPPAANGVCNTLTLEPDGSILVGAAAAAPRRLAHFSGSGTIDLAFNLAADATNDIYDIAVLPNGRGVLATNYFAFQGGAASCLWQISAGLTGLPGTVQFASSSANGNQGTAVTLSVTRTGGSTGELQVGYSTVPGPGHFTPVTGTLYWANGDSAAKTITVPLTLGTLSGPTETCTVNLGQPLLCGVQLGATQQSAITINPAVVPATPGDFNGDAKADIVWQNTVTGDRYLWLMNGTTYVSGVSLGNVSPDLKMVGTADFNGDGKADILWENTVTGKRLIWFMNGSTFISSFSLGLVSTDYHIVAAADFNGDGKPDILFENSLTGDRYLWLMNGSAYSSGVDLGIVSTDWHIAAAADFNADGKPDIVFENTVTGDRYLWLMNGTVFNAGVSLGTVATAWHIAGAGDYNGDGKPDILWENPASGDRGLWVMNGATYVSWVALGNVGSDWRIAH